MLLPFAHKPAVLDCGGQRVLVDPQTLALMLDFILFPTISSHLTYSDNQSSPQTREHWVQLELNLVDVDDHLNQRDSKRHGSRLTWW